MKVLTEEPISSKLLPYYSDLVDNYLEIYLQEFLDTVTLNNEVERISLVYFSKTVNTLSSIKVLIHNKNIVDARILIRSLFENTVLFQKLIQDRETFVRYTTAYQKFNLIAVNKIRMKHLEEDDSGPKHFQLGGVKEVLYVEKSQIEAEINALENDIVALGFTATNNKNSGRPHVENYFNIKAMAESVGLGYFYETMYKNFCLDTHTSAIHLKKYFVNDEQGTELFVKSPYLNERDFMISWATILTEGCIKNLSRIFSFDAGKVVAHEKLQKMMTLCYSMMPLFLQQGMAKKDEKILW